MLKLVFGAFAGMTLLCIVGYGVYMALMAIGPIGALLALMTFVGVAIEMTR